MQLPANCTILPTHHCFEDVAEYVFCATAGNDPQITRYRVVHGLLAIDQVDNNHCFSPAILKRGTWSHAWLIDETDSIIDFGIIEGTTDIVAIRFEPKRHVSHRCRIETTTYTVDEFLRLWSLTDYPGPWRHVYAASCNDGGRERLPHEVSNAGKTERFR